jgi:hypothetical protein
MLIALVASISCNFLETLASPFGCSTSDVDACVAILQKPVESPGGSLIVRINVVDAFVGRAARIASLASPNVPGRFF